MDLRAVIYVAILVGALLAFQRLKGAFLLFSLVILPGTFFHELCHLCIGSLLNGQPGHFTLLPRREDQTWVMGSVSFAHVRWYNAFFLGMAPLMLLPAAYGLLVWRIAGHPSFTWREGLWLYLIANLVYAALPSWQDLRIAARSPIGWLLLACAAAYGWFRFTKPPAQPGTALHQLQEPRFSGVHPAFRDPGADICLSQTHQIG